MANIKICPKCPEKTVMESDIRTFTLQEYGAHLQTVSYTNYVVPPPGLPVAAYSCPSCHYLELYLEKI